MSLLLALYEPGAVGADDQRAGSIGHRFEQRLHAVGFLEITFFCVKIFSLSLSPTTVEAYNRPSENALSYRDGSRIIAHRGQISMNRYGRLLSIETLETRLPFDVDMISGLSPADGHIDLCIWRSETPLTPTGALIWREQDVIETRAPFDWPGDEPAAKNAQLPSYSETSVKIMARATDNEGRELHEVTVGQEFWIELSAQGNRVHEQGVYDARFKVELNAASLALLPQVEPMSGYINGMERVRTPTGFSALGGFSSSFAPLGPEARAVVRFKVRAIEPGEAVVEVSNAALEWSPFLVYGDNFPINPKNVSPATLVLKISVPPSVETLERGNDRTTTSSVSAGEEALVYAPDLVDTAISHVFGNEFRADRSAAADREPPQQIRYPVVLPAESLDEIIAVHSLPLSDRGVEPQTSSEISVNLRAEAEQSAIIGLTVEKS